FSLLPSPVSRNTSRMPLRSSKGLAPARYRQRVATIRGGGGGGGGGGVCVDSSSSSTGIDLEIFGRFLRAYSRARRSHVRSFFSRAAPVTFTSPFGWSSNLASSSSTSTPSARSSSMRESVAGSAGFQPSPTPADVERPPPGGERALSALGS